MRILWLLFITVLLVCGKSGSFEEINDSDIKRETSTSDEDQDEVENSLSSNPVYNFTRRKRSLDGEERMKKQQKFHSWGGKRNDDNDEEEKDEEVDETNSSEYNDAKREDTSVINKTFPKGLLKEENMISYVKGRGFKGFEDNIPQEDKRDPEITDDLRKRAYFYDSFLPQVGFHPELSEQNSKRYPAFNSWAGKRSTAFNSWGGKRAAPFNSWGGKRQAAFNSWGGKRDAASFNSWGGKRDPESNNWGRRGSASFNSWGGKRGAYFNSWGGKRAAPFNSWGGKRTAAFNSWAGKRDLEDLDEWEKAENLANHNRLEQVNDSYKTPNNIDYLTNQQNYDTTKTKYSPENIKDKRVATFNSWAGKRIGPLNNPGGKKSAAFNSWGGKRSSSSFSSWGGKRGDLYNSLAGKSTFDVVESPKDVQDTSNHETFYESSDNDHSDEDVSARSDSNDLLQNAISHWITNKPKSEVFESELNKHDELISPGSEHELRNTRVENILRSSQRYFDSNKEEINKRSNPAFSSWAGKRAPLFTPWYSNKTPSLLISSGKRRPAFSSWGGKRSELQPLQGKGCYNSNSNECLDLPEENVLQTDGKKLNGELREKREVNCSSDEEIATHDEPGKSLMDKKFDSNLKKNRVMTRMMFQGGLSRPMAIKSLARGLDFYAWGGKRSL